MTQLFLVQFTLQHSRYSPNCLPPFEERKVRLVEADDADAARRKVEQAYNYSSPGSDSVYVVDTDVSEVLR